MNRIMKKSLSLLLAFIMCLSLMPATVFADGPSLTAGVSGYTDGDEWTEMQPKSLNLNVAVPTTAVGQEYSIKITLAAGMRFNGFAWNSSWGVKPASVLGSATTMTDGSKSLLIDNTAEFFENGAGAGDDITVLTYTIGSGTEAINLSDSVTVMPDNRYAYEGDVINDGIKIQLLDYAGNVKAEKKISVTNKMSPSVIMKDIFVSGKSAVAPGSTDVKIYDIYNSVRCMAQTVVVTMPTCIENAYPVAKGADFNTFNWNASTHELTINWNAPKAEANAKFEIWGDVAASATIGTTYTAANPITSTITMYDGESKTEAYTAYYGNASKMLPTVTPTAPSTDLQLKTTYHYVFANGSDPTINGLLSDLRFMTNTDLTTDQIVSFEFTDELLVKGVVFPIDNADTLKNINITFDDGTSLTIPSLPKSDGLVRVHMGTIKAYDSTVTGNYITSISANCGTFSAGYASFSSGSLAKTRIIGRFGDSIVADDVDCDVDFTVKINGVESPVASYAEYLTSSKPRFNVDCDSVYYDSSFTSLKSSFLAGEDIGVKVNLNCFYPSILSEPHFYVVVPNGFTVDKSSMQILQNTTVVNSSKIHVKEFPVEDVSGTVYNAIEVYGEGTKVTVYTPDGGPDTKNVYLKFILKSDMAAASGNYFMNDWIYIGNQDHPDEVFLPNPNASSRVSVDPYDIDNDSNRGDTGAFVTCNTSVFTLSENKNVTVSGYLSESSGATSGLPAYDPGLDGSSDVNSVTMKADGIAYYNVVIKNSLDTSANPAAVKAYIPIPSGSIAGSTFTPQNTDSSFVRYQFDDYNWPLALTGPVVNPDPSVFNVLYYKGTIVLDSEGKPTNTVAYTNVASFPAGEAEKITMIAIVSKDGVEIPKASGSVPYEQTFELPLSVGVNEAQATAANLNNTKNIFRPYFWRSSDAGAGYTNANYVAAKLSIGRIQGFAYTDVDHDGLYIATNGDTKLPGVEVKLYLDTDTSFMSAIQTQITDTYGNYSFNGLANKKYIVRFKNPASNTTDPDASGAMHFAKIVAYDPTTNYQFDSDSVAESNHDYGVAKVSLPKTGLQASAHNDYVCAGFEAPLTVNIKNDDSSKGHITVTTANDADATAGVNVHVWNGDTLTEPTKTPVSGFSFKQWRLGGTAYEFTTPITAEGYITAHWVGNAIALTFDANSADGSATFPTAGGETLTGITVMAGTAISDALSDGAYEEPTRAGYSFGGWYMNEACTTPIGSELMPTTATTIYAKWTSGNVTVTFDSQGGKFSTTGTTLSVAKTGAVAASMTADIPTVTKEHYNFVGWYSDSAFSAASKLTTASAVYPSTATTYYAKWETKTYTSAVKFDYNGGSYNSAASVTMDGVFGSTISDTIAAYTGSDYGTPTKAGYSLIGWLKTPANVIVLPANINAEKIADPMNTSAPHIVYKAQWQPVNANITFNANSGAFTSLTGTPTTTTYTQPFGSNLTLSRVPTPIRANYKFVGWATTNIATSADVTGTVAFDNASGKTYYAVWEAAKYKLTYKLNGGNISGTTADVVETNIQFSHAPSISAPAPVFAGKTLSGWLNMEDGAMYGTSYVPTSMTSDVTLMAQWSGANFNITFTKYNGPTSTVTYAAPDGTKPAAPDIVPSAGKVFQNWIVKSVDANGLTMHPTTGNPLAADDTLSIAQLFDLTIHGVLSFEAVYAPLSINVKFDLNGGTQTSGEPTSLSQNITYDTAPTAPTGSKVGYKFDKWLNTMQNTYAAQSAIGTTNLKENTVYVAQWIIDNKTVTLNNNFTSGGTQSITVQNGGNIDMSTYRPTATKPGYTFIGWATTSGATTPDVTGSMTISADTTYYAVWTNVLHTVIFKDKAGTELAKDTAMAEGSMVSSSTIWGTTGPTAPTVAGFTFVGWTKGGEVASADWTTVKSTAVNDSITYIATYSQNAKTVTFNANGGNFSGGATYTVNVAENGTLNVDYAASPSKATNAFQGWSTTADDTSTQVTGNQTITADITYYALWVSTAIPAGPYTVTFNAGSNGAMTPATFSESVTGGSTLTTLPTIAANTNYTFLGWMKDSGATKYSNADVLAMQITTDTAFTAAYQLTTTTVVSGGGGGGGNRGADSYSLGFQENGGSEVTPISAESGTTIELSKFTSTRAGYEFEGWYTEKSLINKVTSLKLTGNKIVYAKWTLNADFNTDDHVAYVQGYNGGEVRPNANITRAETATMLYRLLTDSHRAEIDTKENSFKDMNGNEWFNEAVSTMSKGGYVTGYEDGSFGGNRTITRAEFVTMLVRFIGVDDKAVISYLDVTSDRWSYPYIATASNNGWVSGYGNGFFGANQAITRAEAMTIINRVLGRGVDADSELLNFIDFRDNRSATTWYYYEVIEASNGHNYIGSRPSEDWTKIY